MLKLISIFLFYFQCSFLFSLQLKLNDSSLVDLPDNLASFSGTLQELKDMKKDAPFVLVPEITPLLFPKIKLYLQYLKDNKSELSEGVKKIINECTTDEQIAELVNVIYFLDVPGLLLTFKAAQQKIGHSKKRIEDFLKVISTPFVRDAYLSFDKKTPMGLQLHPSDAKEDEAINASLSLIHFSETLKNLIDDIVEGNDSLEEKAKQLPVIPVEIDKQTLSLFCSIFNDAYTKTSHFDNEQRNSLFASTLISLLWERSSTYQNVQKLFYAALWLDVSECINALMKYIKLRVSLERDFNNPDLKNLLVYLMQILRDDSILNYLLPSTKTVSIDSKNDPYFYATFSPTGSYVSAITEKGTAWLWSIKERNELKVLFKVPLKVPQDTPFKITFSPQYLLFSNVLCDIPTAIGTPLQRLCPLLVDYSGKTITPAGINFGGLEGNAVLSPRYNNLELASSSKSIVYSAGQGIIYFCDIGGNPIKNNNTTEDRILNPEKPVFSVSFSNDGSKILTVSKEMIKVWDSSNDALLFSISFSYPIIEAYFSPKGNFIAISYKRDRDFCCDVFSAYDGKHISTIAGGHPEKIISASFSPDESYLLTASAGEGINIWNCATGKKHITMKQQGRLVQSAFFAPVVNNIIVAYKLTTSDPRINSGKLEIIPFPLFSTPLQVQEAFKKEIEQKIKQMKQEAERQLTQVQTPAQALMTREQRGRLIRQSLKQWMTTFLKKNK